MPEPALSVVIPTYKRAPLLAQCLAALRNQTVDPAVFDVSVIDDHSGDETTQVLHDAETSMPNLRWASQPENRGPAAARNAAVALGSGRTLLFIDDDIVATPDLVETHLRLQDGKGDQHGVVGHVTWHPDLEVTTFMEWVEANAIQFDYPNMAAGRQDNVATAFYTCNLSFSRAAFEAAGGFDERFPYPACEDTDLGIRLAKSGFSLWYCPEALAWHSRPVTLDDLRRRLRQTASSKDFLAELHPDVMSATAHDGSPPDTAPWRALRAVKRIGLRGAARVAPQLGSVDVRSLHYRCELGHAHLAGLRDHWMGKI